MAPPHPNERGGGNGPPQKAFDTLFPARCFLNRGADFEGRGRLEDRFETLEIAVERQPVLAPRAGGRGGRLRDPLVFALRLALRRARQAGVPSLVIFGEGLEVHPHLHEVVDEVELPAGWEVCFFGCSFGGRPARVGKGVVRVGGVEDVFAVAVRSGVFGELSRALRRGREKSGGGSSGLAPLIKVLGTICGRGEGYALFPPLAWPEETAADGAAGKGVAGKETGEEGGSRGEEGDLAHAPPGLAAEVCGGRRWEPTPWPPQNGSASKVAFLFLTREDLNHTRVWEEYFRAYPGEFGCYAHAKNPGSVAEPFLKAALIPEQVPTEWGHVSLVRATLALLREALKDPENGFFVLASEHCVPVKPFGELRKLLRFDPRGMVGQIGREGMLQINPRNHLRLRSAPLVPLGSWRFHSQWVLLNREMAELCVRSDVTGVFERSFAADEAYFATALNMMGYPLKERVSAQEPTYTRWVPEIKNHPKTFTDVDAGLAAELARSPHFFARKFARGSNIGTYGLHLAGNRTLEEGKRR